MKTLLKYLPASAGMLLAGLLLAGLLGSCECKEGLPESIENLCDGYWHRSSGDDRMPLIQFAKEGQVRYWHYRYESDEEKFYAWDDTKMDRTYAIDVANSTLCVLPDEWYDIYVLSTELLVLADAYGGIVKRLKLSADRVIVLTESQFKTKYPDRK